MIDLIDTPDEIRDYFTKYIDLDSDMSIVLSTSTIFNLDAFSGSKIENFINLRKSNDIRRLNKFFEHVNDKLPLGGHFIGCAETFEQRRTRILSKFPIFLNQIYFLFDFIFKRIFPKLKLTQKLYFFITHGKGRVFSKAEVLGRLVCCGFEIVDFTEFNNLHYFVAKKVNTPVYDMNPSYGPIFKMQRVGKGGKVIGVYKIRTMHPYSEYLQNYILDINGYTEIGKPNNDFRITGWGRFFRKYWLDEVPQLLNLLKGEMSLVGVRPVSDRFLKEYPPDLKELRLKYKPGCIPPYVALKMQSVEEYLKSERIYLEQKEKHPLSTDFRFFFKAVYNILTRKIVSG